VIAPTCDRCGDELDRPGALVVSPPLWGPGRVQKYHVCYDCWPALHDTTTGRTGVVKSEPVPSGMVRVVDPDEDGPGVIVPDRPISDTVKVNVPRSDGSQDTYEVRRSGSA